MNFVCNKFKDTKLKYVCFTKSAQLSQYQLFDEGSYPVYGASGVAGYLNKYDEKKPYLGIIKDGAGVGRINKYSSYSSLLGTLSYILPNKDINIDWLLYTIQSLNLSESIDKTTIPHIYFSEYGNKKIKLVPINLQKRIASFLDSKCAEIDSITEDIQKEIETLQEYRKSVITEAVTKGLNPNVAMKDSGVDWIGEIPQTWKIVKLKYVLTERKEKSIFGTELLLSVSQYKGVIPSGKLDNRTMQADSLIGYKIVKKNDLVFNKLNPGLARFGCSEYDGITSPDFAVYIPNNPYMSVFLAYLLKTNRYVSEFKKTGTGVGDGFARLYTPQLFNFLIAIPDIIEIKKITDYLQHKCSEIDSIIKDKQKQLDTLAEYRKSLIYEYVTGKKEVPTV